MIVFIQFLIKQPRSSILKSTIFDHWILPMKISWWLRRHGIPIMEIILTFNEISNPLINLQGVVTPWWKHPSTGTFRLLTKFTFYFNLMTALNSVKMFFNFSRHTKRKYSTVSKTQKTKKNTFSHFLMCQDINKCIVVMSTRASKAITTQRLNQTCGSRSPLALCPPRWSTTRHAKKPSHLL